MLDKREDIIGRVVAIAGTVSGILKVARNVVEISKAARPAIVIWDGDEVTKPWGPTGRSTIGMRPMLVTMTLDVRLMLEDAATLIGGEFNLYRRRFLAALLGDATLIGLIGPNGDLRYEGLTTELAPGQKMEGEMALSIAIDYVLKPEDLA
jgi:hypothetical protein